MRQINWTCPKCKQPNVDTRSSFVLCVHCGQTYDTVPTYPEQKKTA